MNKKEEKLLKKLKKQFKVLSDNNDDFDKFTNNKSTPKFLTKHDWPLKQEYSLLDRYLPETEHVKNDNTKGV
jgi:hypothetical protein